MFQGRLEIAKYKILIALLAALTVVKLARVAITERNYMCTCNGKTRKIPNARPNVA